MLDSVWDPAGFAHARIDTALGQSMRPALTRFLHEAATELILLDPASAGGARPVLSQIIALIDEVARNARTVLL